MNIRKMQTASGGPLQLTPEEQILTKSGKMKIQWDNPNIYYKNGGKIQ